MHEWHSRCSTIIVQLINEFMGYRFNTDYSGNEEVTNINITSKIFKDSTEARDYVTRSSYGSNTAVIAAYTTKKLSKAYQNAFNNFITRRKEYVTFEKELNIGYGRKSSKVTCPECGSSISLHYGKRFKDCPICHSRKIISDSNWKALETKERMMKNASEILQREASKNEVTFICGIEWHC